MKIAVTAADPSLDATIDPRFGRCPYFLIVETEDLRFEAVANPSLSLGGGAGIQAAQLMADYTLIYNKVRQAAITAEILDIVGGANALQASIDHVGEQAVGVSRQIAQVLVV